MAGTSEASAKGVEPTQAGSLARPERGWAVRCIQPCINWIRTKIGPGGQTRQCLGKLNFRHLRSHSETKHVTAVIPRAARCCSRSGHVAVAIIVRAHAAKVLVSGADDNPPKSL